MATQENNILLYDKSSAKYKTLDTSDTLKWSLDTIIDANLTVTGTTTSVHSETVLIKDNYLDLNHGYSSDAAQQGGLTVNYDPTTTKTTSASFTAGSSAGPIVAVASASGFAVDDIIQISDATDDANDGLYIIKSISSNDLTVYGTGGTAVPAAHTWAKNQFTTNASDTAGTVCKVAISIMKVDSSGDWQVGKGSNIGSLSYAAIQTGTDSSETLQSAYEAGSTITTDASNGAVTVAGNQLMSVSTSAGLQVSGGPLDVNTSVDFDGTTFAADASGAISLDAGAASNFSTSSGALTLSGAGGVSIAGSASEVDVTTTGALDLNFDTMTADGDGITLTAASDIDLAATVEVDITAAQVDVNASSTLTMDSADTTNLTMTANSASDKTLTVKSANSGSGKGSLLLEGAGRTELCSGASTDGSISIISGYAAGTGTPPAQGFHFVGLKGNDGSLTTNDGGSVVGVYASSAVEERLEVYAKNTSTGSATMRVAGVAKQSDNGKVEIVTGYFDASDQQQLDGSRGSVVINTKTLDIDSAAATDILAATTLSAKGATGASFGDDTATWEFDGSGALSESGMTSCSITPSGAITLTAGAASTWSTSSGALTLDGASGVSIAGNAAEIDVTTSGALDLNSGAGTWSPSTLAIDPSSTFDLDAAGAITMDGASFTLGGDGDTGAIAMTATSAAVTITGAGVSLAGGSSEIDLTTSGTIDVNAGTFDLNCTGAAWDIATDTSGAGLRVNANSASAVYMNIDATNAGSGGGYVAIGADEMYMIADGNAEAFLRVSGSNGVNAEVGIVGTAGEALTKGDLVYTHSSGAVLKADASAIGTAFVSGVAISTVSASATTNVASLDGSLAKMSFDSAPTSSDYGKRVYLSETAGKATLTPPTTSGAVQYQIGILSFVSGSNYHVQLQRQFLAEVP